MYYHFKRLDSSGDNPNMGRVSPNRLDQCYRPSVHNHLEVGVPLKILSFLIVMKALTTQIRAKKALIWWPSAMDIGPSIHIHLEEGVPLNI